MLHASEISTTFLDGTSPSKIVLEVREEDHPEDKTQISVEAPSDVSKEAKAYMQNVRGTPRTINASIEPLQLSHSHGPNHDDPETVARCQGLQHKCSDAHTVTCIFPDALQDLIDTIITTADMAPSGATNTEARFDTNGHRATNTSIDEQALQSFCNSPIWICIYSMLTSETPPVVKLFIHNFEIFLETFTNALARLDNTAQGILPSSGPLHDICQLNTTPFRAPTQQTDKKTNAGMAFYATTKSNTFPRTKGKNYTYHSPRLSEDFSSREATPGWDVPRSMPSR
ncbi:hypothetical protein PMZ80_005284 [Knufia obscura]|uniref:Uncharacterized protein n=2 Tax=Knufia TaxID=430999 RepID=A0AAN8IC41_9EURO|nr:hypothetical protein PMZ80_005284 [Knufia obscura]KAK5957951.1 hypothetical protein OHC33_001141 [Knufia fluminis]